MSWFRIDDVTGVVRVVVQVQPGARSCSCQATAAWLQVRVMASALEGKANKALCEYLATRLKVSPSRVRIVHGLTSRKKLVEIEAAYFDAEKLSTSGDAK